MQGEDKICVIGSANVDSFVYVHHIPAPGETLQALSSMMANGGKGANQAVAVGKLAGSALFVGQVGNDDGKQMLEKEMTAANVELGWKVREDVPTGKAFICVEEKTGENVIVIVGGANTQYESKENLPVEYSEVITRSKCILLQKQIPMEINVLCAKEAKSKGKTVILDCGGADEPIPEELLQNLDILSPNETELLRIQADIDISKPAEEIRKKILNKYPNLKVLLKLGSKGSAIITKEHFVEVPVVTTSNPAILENYKIEDTVGAGDCFTGAFMVKFEELNWNDPAAHQSNFRKAMTFGNSAAFLCITKKGAMPSMPSRLQVDEFMGKYQLE